MKRFVPLFILPLLIWISCGGEKYDHIKEGQRFNKNTGEVEYKTDKGWMHEEEYEKIRNRVKDVLKNISMASKMYNQTYNEITFDIKLLEESGHIAIDKEIKDMWKFSSDAKGTLLTAESTDGLGTKIHYNLQTGSYE